jgi:hypothetical protein
LSVCVCRVPSEFNRNTFAAAGVPKAQLRILHEVSFSNSLLHSDFVS